VVPLCAPAALPSKSISPVSPEHGRLRDLSAGMFCHLQANLALMTTRIAELVSRSERLGEEGDVDGAQAAVAEMETLKVGMMHLGT
jgi:hypothetical protein